MRLYKGETDFFKPQIIVAQMGARMHYAVPVLLHRAGMLAQLYTDAYAGNGSLLKPGLRLSAAVPKGLCPPWLKRLQGRREDGLPGTRVTAFNLFGIRYVLALGQAKTLKERERLDLEYGQRFCRLVIKHSLKGANGVYAFNNVALELFHYAREQGMRTILDQISAPYQIEHQLFSEEYALFPGWESPYLGLEVWGRRLEQEAAEWARAEGVICGSPFVAEGLASLGVNQDKLHVTPYGIDIRRFETTAKKWEGRRELRVLFVGGITLRKGVQYLYKAMEKMRTAAVVWRLVGPVLIQEPYRRLLQSYCELTGPVPRVEIRQHYDWADVFVFPSVCEGSAAVTYEALAAGLPVITTPNAGSVVKDGIDGFIVSIRDVEGLTEKIDLLAGNPELLAWLSQNALKKAREYSWEKYGERLVNRIKSIYDR
jgi:glycosyltransferase involved in cell wall biosynthesis